MSTYNCCKIIEIKTIKTNGVGQLSFFEFDRDIPFEAKRIYYICDVPKDGKRGFHAHKLLKQFIFCPYGEIKLILNDGFKKEEIILDDPSIGIFIDKPVWRDIIWLKKNSVLCVAASDYYSEDDYIRDYSLFIDYIKSK